MVSVVTSCGDHGIVVLVVVLVVLVVVLVVLVVVLVVLVLGSVVLVLVVASIGATVHAAAAPARPTVAKSAHSERENGDLVMFDLPSNPATSIHAPSGKTRTYRVELNGSHGTSRPGSDRRVQLEAATGTG